jgi:hypothetical protein
MVCAEMNSKLTGQPKAFVFGQLSNNDIRELEANLKTELQNLGLWKAND